MIRIINSQFGNNGGSGIVVRGGEVDIVGCQSYNNGKHGYDIYASGRVKNSQAWGNQLSGLKIQKPLHFSRIVETAKENLSIDDAQTVVIEIRILSDKSKKAHWLDSFNRLTQLPANIVQILEPFLPALGAYARM